jgi:hypothetical protein
VAQHRSQHDIHLHVREGRTNAAPDAATERDPGEAGWFGSDEALRLETVRVREDIRVGV